MATWRLFTLKAQLAQMLESSESDSDAWQKQLDIMQGQLTHIEQASHLEQRAWVGLSRSTHKPIEPNEPIQGEFRFSNTGKTPATIISAGRTVCLRPPGFNIESIADIKETKEWMEDARSQGPLSPNAFIVLDFATSKKVDAPLKEQLEKGEICVYVIGRILYRDIFDRKHETRFCRIVDPKTERMIIAYQYNYMD
jgi:hypothetical protein